MQCLSGQTSSRVVVTGTRGQAAAPAARATGGGPAGEAGQRLWLHGSWYSLSGMSTGGRAGRGSGRRARLQVRGAGGGDAAHGALVAHARAALAAAVLRIHLVACARRRVVLIV